MLGKITNNILPYILRNRIKIQIINYSNVEKKSKNEYVIFSFLFKKRKN